MLAAYAMLVPEIVLRAKRLIAECTRGRVVIGKDLVPGSNITYVSSAHSVARAYDHGGHTERGERRRGWKFESVSSDTAARSICRTRFCDFRQSLSVLETAGSLTRVGSGFWEKREEVEERGEGRRGRRGSREEAREGKREQRRRGRAEASKGEEKGGRGKGRGGYRPSACSLS
eukprot:1131339-Rhodomonas_salina.3